MDTDTEYETVTFKDVREREDGYEIVRDDGWSFYIAKQYDDDPPHRVVPKAGDLARFYGGGIGSIVRGVAIWSRDDSVWRPVFYRTEQQQQDRNHAELAASEAKQLHEFETKGRALLDADYEALPDVFQRRIDKFRANNPDFRWKYEGYEMFCCTEAVKLARHLGTIEAMHHYTSLATHETFKTDEERWNREWEEQKAIDAAAGLSDGHSGNTHGAAVALASWFLGQPENVVKMHGAMSPLVGSAEYGDVPPNTSSP